MNGKQLTLRSMVIGVIGSVVITCSSMYVALKLSSLPWPIMFVALFSMLALKALGNTNLNEINVAHTAMSAGAMVAGGLAFTIPGIWILNPKAEISTMQLLVIALGGVILGLIFTALIRKYFVETKDLPYAMGQAAAETLQVGDEGGKKAGTLFASMGIAAVFTVIRDWFGKIPATLMSQKMLSFGSAGGIWLSPMLVSIGYIVGPIAIGVWFLGALLGDAGILIGGQACGIWTLEEATGVKQALGIGLMVGTGVGILVKGILPKAKEIFGGMFSKDSAGDSIVPMRWAPFVMILIAAVLTIVCKMSVIASVITILGVWLATAMSAQCVGQSGINPMEIFGIIVLLAAKGLTVVAVACGLVGDVMNDFKEGHMLRTNPKAQWIAEAVGGVIGAVVSVFVLVTIVKAYGPAAFTDGQLFTAAQANTVAAMVGGISNLPAFLAGLVIAVVLYCINFPVMTLGLGVYLPFYMSATAFIGGALRFIADKWFPAVEKNATGQIIASGLLGGEAVVGVVIALITAVQAL